MRTKEFSSKMTGKFYASLLVFFVFMLLISALGYSYEREVVLGEEYQTPKEKERYKFKTEEVTFKDRFKLDLNFGIGGYYGSSSNVQLYGIDPKIDAYVKRLDMHYSENIGAARLTATYFITQKLAIYLGVPFGVVNEDKGQGYFDQFNDINLNFGVGDISGGISYTLLSGTESKPNIAIAVDVDSNTSKYYSLGDGLWDYTIGSQVNQLLSKSFYIFGLGSYTFRAKKSGIY